MGQTPRGGVVPCEGNRYPARGLYPAGEVTLPGGILSDRVLAPLNARHGGTLRMGYPVIGYSPDAIVKDGAEPVPR